VVHGDLKPANLLLCSNSGKVKIADFGSSIMNGGAGSERGGGMRSAACGFSTPAFRSPESLTSGYTPSYEMDMWALGVCVFMWVFGGLPFTGMAPSVIYERIRAQDVCVPRHPEVSPELRDFLGRLLERDACARLDVAAAMQHPWVTLHGSAPLISTRQQQGGGGAGAAAGGGAGGGGVADSWVLEATPEEIAAAIKQIGGGGVSELMEAVFAEQLLQPG
jgi:serine/threonine protein kinase